MKHNAPYNSLILKKNNKGFTLLCSEQNKPTVNKTVYYCVKTGKTILTFDFNYISLYFIILSTYSIMLLYSQLIFNKGTKAIHWEITVYSKYDAETNGYLHASK